MKKKEKKEWIANLGIATFIGRKKIGERIIKKNLTNKDLEIIELFL